MIGHRALIKTCDDPDLRAVIGAKVVCSRGALRNRRQKADEVGFEHYLFQDILRDLA